MEDMIFADGKVEKIPRLNPGRIVVIILDRRYLDQC